MPLFAIDMITTSCKTDSQTVAEYLSLNTSILKGQPGVIDKTSERNHSTSGNQLCRSQYFSCGRNSGGSLGCND